MDGFVYQLGGEMKIKRTTRGKANIEQKDSAHVRGNHAVAEALRPQSDRGYRERMLSYIFRAAFTAFGSLTVALAIIRFAYLLFSDLPNFPQAFAFLVIIVVSSLGGILVTFLLVYIISQKRQAEREDVLERVRLKERELFEMLDLDFDSITRRRELDAGQTV